MKLLALMLCGLLVAGCASTPGTAVPATTTWIFTQQALDAITANPQAKARLTGARIFEILKANQQPSTAVAVIPTESFKSFATLQRTLDKNRLDPGIRAVIYDAEHWAQTPVTEQRDPVTYYQKAAKVAHAHGLTFIATPAMDLVNATGQKATNPTAQFLSENIDGGAARSADVLDIQAQSLERDTASYRDFVTKAAAQARSANPAVTVIAGLSTNPHGSAITPDMLVSDMTAMAGTASGFWMNIPDQGTDCPDCRTPRPDVAVGALSDSRLATLFSG